MASIGALAWLQAGSNLLQSVGARETGRAARIQGEQARVAAQFNARQAERDAGRVMALAIRQSAEERRQAGLVASRALAVAAASGGGAADPDVLNAIARTKGEGHLRAAYALYDGESKARQLKMDAILGRASGFQTEAAYASQAAGASMVSLGYLAKGGASLYAKYGQNGPKGDGALIASDQNDYAVG